MIYVLNKKDFRFIGRYDSMKLAKECIVELGNAIDDCIFTEEMGVDYDSRVVMVDGEWVYKNKDFWYHKAADIAADYDNHTVYDILEVSKPEAERTKVELDRFKREMEYNINRINAMDGNRSGQSKYNWEVAQDFIALFHEECILTNFTKESNTSPMIIFTKLVTPIIMLIAGAFREAWQYLYANKSKLVDDFLTEERIDKYIAMIKSADAIEYATEADYFYTVPESTDTESTDTESADTTT